MDYDIKHLKIQVNNANATSAVISILLVFTIGMSLLSHRSKDELISLMQEDAKLAKELIKLSKQEIALLKSQMEK